MNAAWAQQDSAAAPALPVPPPAEPAGAAGPGLRWRLPPVSWGGSLSYDYRLDHVGDEPQRHQHLVGLNLSALTYLYQPWLATVSATLGLTHSWRGGEPQGGSGQDQFVTGALRLTLFPRSRFPSELRLEQSDSRNDASLGGNTDYRARTLALTQRYRPAGGEFNLSATLEHRSQEGPSFGEDTQDQLMADFSARWKRQALAANLARSRSRHANGSEENDFATVSLRHTFNPDTALTLETGANWARSADHLALGDNRVDLTQWSTVALWRPEGKPWSLSASLRSFNLATSTRSAGQDDSPTVRNESLALSLGGQYEFSPQLRLTANASVTRLNGDTRESWVGALGASYQGPTRNFGEGGVWQHDWSAGGAFSSAHNAGLTDDTVSGQVGQSVSRTWRQAPTQALSLTLGQTLSASWTHAASGVDPGAASGGGGLVEPGSVGGWSRALLHSASLTWTRSGEDGSAFARASASDARQLDGEHARFQLLNLQLSGNVEIDRFSGWSGDLTVQRVFQRSLPQTVDAADPFGYDRLITHTAGGEITWRHSRAFGIARLRFSTRLRLSHDTQHQRRALVPLPERETGAWESRLDYQVGRLQTGALLRLAKSDGLWQQTLTLRLQRSFGE
jgi:hypothetical protein